MYMLTTFMQCAIAYRLMLIDERLEWLAQADLSSTTMQMEYHRTQMDHYLTVQAAHVWFPHLQSITN